MYWVEVLLLLITREEVLLLLLPLDQQERPQPGV